MVKVSVLVTVVMPTCTLNYYTGVEKNNDDAKRNYFSSNRHDAAGDILRTEAILEELRRGKFGVCVRKREHTRRPMMPIGMKEVYRNQGEPREPIPPN